MPPATCPRPIRSGPALGLAIATLLGALPQAAGAQVQRCHLDAEQVFAKTEPSIVEIFSDAINQFRVSDRIQSGLGTGFLLQDGVVVTNFHVIADAQRVDVFDGTDWWGATTVGIDPLLDIAVLQLTYFGDGKAAMDQAPPDSIKIGQKAFAIGFPRGMGKTITEGIVTGTGRVLPESTNSWLNPYLQTDATVNPGNSGGPLLDDCGRAIGMVSRATLPNIAENTAFAIPISVLSPIVDEIVATGHVSRAWHGLYGQMVAPPVLALLGVPPEAWADYTGFMVETVEPGSAADRAGIHGGDWPVEISGHPFLLGGDIITEVNGTRILDRDTALNVVSHVKVGETVSLTYRRGSERHSISVKIAERPVLEADLDMYRQ